VTKKIKTTSERNFTPLAQAALARNTLFETFDFDFVVLVTLLEVMISLFAD